MKGNVWGKGKVTEFFEKKIKSLSEQSLLDRTVATHSCLPEKQERPGPGGTCPWPSGQRATGDRLADPRERPWQKLPSCHQLPVPLPLASLGLSSDGSGLFPTS